MASPLIASSGLLEGNRLRLIELPGQELESFPKLNDLRLNFAALLFITNGIQKSQDRFVAALRVPKCSFRRAAFSSFDLGVSPTRRT